MKDLFKVHGAFTLAVERADGTFEVLHKDNLVVDVGFDLIADSLAAPAGRPAVLSHIAIGTNNTAVTTADTALGTESDRQAATYSHVPGTKVFTMTSSHTGLTAAIVEAGMFNDGVAGSMFDRVVFPVINISSGDTLTAKFTVTMS